MISVVIADVLRLGLLNFHGKECVQGTILCYEVISQWRADFKCAGFIL